MLAPREGFQLTVESHGGAFVGLETITLEELWSLEASMHNHTAFLHRLWGQASRGEYRAQEWSAFQDLDRRLFGLREFDDRLFA